MNLQYIWYKILKKAGGRAITKSHVHNSAKIEAGSIFVNSSMDRYSYCGYDCEIINCKIGAFCSIANRTVIGGAMHPMAWGSTSPVFYAGRDSAKVKFASHQRDQDQETRIGNDVWIGARVMIKQGVSVGDGAILGMGSIVTKDVPPYQIWAGNPARFIRNRFPEETIEQLLNIAWWNFDEDKLREFGIVIKDINAVTRKFGQKQTEV